MLLCVLAGICSVSSAHGQARMTVSDCSSSHPPNQMIDVHLGPAPILQLRKQ